MKKDTAIEIRQIGGHLELFLHTDLEGSFKNAKEGIPVVNPIEGFRLLKNTTDRFHWIDRNDVIIRWENAKSERGTAFSDVALLDEKSGEYDAWLIAEVLTVRQSEITNSPIGSSHWFRTIVSEHSRIGEYIEQYAAGEIDPNMLQSWGKRLHDTSMELINWSDKTKVLTNE